MELRVAAGVAGAIVVVVVVFCFVSRVVGVAWFLAQKLCSNSIGIEEARYRTFLSI